MTSLRAGLTNLVILGLSLWLVPVAAAQDAPAAASPASRTTMDTVVSVGQTVVVDLKNNERHKGEVVAVSAVTLQLGRSKEAIAASDILSIRIRVRDPIRDGLKRGAVLGGLAGAVIGYLRSAQRCQEFECSQANLGGGFIGLWTGAAIGAITGGILDERHQQERVVWRPSPVAGRLARAPMATTRHAGAHVRIRW